MIKLVHAPATVRRRLLALCATLGVLASSPSHAADFPARPITVVVPFPAGGTPDILARVLGESISKKTGQSVVIENRGGAGGNIGGQVVAHAKPDGYTLLVCTFGCGVAQLIYNPPPFIILKDLVPAASIGTVPSVFETNPKVPGTTVAELLAYARANPGKLNAASSGIGSSPHLALELLNSQTGVRITHVPYKGTGQVMTDLLGGQVDVFFDNLPSSLPHIKSGKLRALAVASEKRSPAIADVPTFTEGGVQGVLITPWFGIMAPSDVPEPVLDQINTLFNDALRTPAIAEKMEQSGVTVVSGNRAMLGRFIAAETEKWKPIVQKNNIRVD